MRNDPNWQENWQQSPAQNLPAREAFFPTGKKELLFALSILLSAGVLWADVDTQVAAYNVDAYLSGQMENIDITYLCSLSDGAIPHIFRLIAEAPEKPVSDMAGRMLKDRSSSPGEDFRSWNYANYLADQFLSGERILTPADAGSE